MSEDTKLQQLIINTLSPEQFEGIIDPSSEELYLVEDDAEYASVDELNTHTTNTTIHVTSQDKTNWNNKQDTLIAGANINIDESTNEISVTGDLGSKVTFRDWSVE